MRPGHSKCNFNPIRLHLLFGCWIGVIDAQKHNGTSGCRIKLHQSGTKTASKIIAVIKRLSTNRFVKIRFECGNAISCLHRSYPIAILNTPYSCKLGCIQFTSLLLWEYLWYLDIRKGRPHCIQIGIDRMNGANQFHRPFLDRLAQINIVFWIC